MAKWMIAYLLLAGLATEATGQEELQKDTSGVIHYGVAAQGVVAGKQVPFWMRTNQAGSIPLHGASLAISGQAFRDYDFATDKKKLLDWGGAIEGRANLGNRAEFLLIEAYLKARIGPFQLKAGRSRDRTGLVDSTLSSGAFSVSGNALGIPKVEISIPDFWDLPFTNQILALKGNFAYGYFGHTELLYHPNGQKNVKSYYHQKSLYFRIGKPAWRLKMYAGFNHQVMWGSEQQIFGEKFGLNHWQTFQYAVMGKTYGAWGVPHSKIGNHIGSIDQALEYRFEAVKLTAYHQFFYEVGGLYHLTNIKDGLWGLSFENQKAPNQDIVWNKILIELVTSKSQGGERNAKPSPSGDEDYYNNSLYVQGWTYQQENVGSNFMTNRNYIRKNLPADQGDYINNNRIYLIHLAVDGSVKKVRLQGRFSFSRNFGTYATSPDGSTTGKRRIIKPPPYFLVTAQFSGYLEAAKPLKNGFLLGVGLAVDQGQLLYNSVGGYIKLSRTW